jgi:hypothetical protein
VLEDELVRSSRRARGCTVVLRMPAIARDEFPARGG